MENRAAHQKLRDLLFSVPGEKVFCVLDGAAVPDLLNDLYTLQPEYECLYRGELEASLAWVAPYLVLLEPGHPFTRFVLEEGWGKSWGIFATSTAAFDDVRRHFRRFLMVHTADGKPLYFRYYDPRVLGEFLPVADREQITTMFNLLNSYFAEASGGAQLVRFEVSAGSLVRHVFELSGASEAS